MRVTDATEAWRSGGVESRYAWVRLAAVTLLGTIGGVGMWSVVVVLPFVQAEFGTARGEASLPYTFVMLGFVGGGVLFGQLADRRGAMLPALIGAVSLCLGYVATAFAPSMIVFALLSGVLIGLFGASAVFAPLAADTSRWFDRHRGIAVALGISGNYFAGAIWPPILQVLVADHGWRGTHLAIGVICLVTMIPLALVLSRPVPAHAAPGPALARSPDDPMPLGLRRNTLQGLIMVAAVACCVAMSMPQVHIVAYCVDLGYGPARGAEMLALMLGFGIVSRLISGWVMDRIGGLATLLLGSVLQGIALALYLPFDGLVALYIVSAVFGLFQGGIVPAYAFIVREYFPAAQAGVRVGLAISATLAGMALGGWLSGVMFDLTGSYQAAVLNGLAWNALNVSIVAWLLRRALGRAEPAAATA
ncbi:MFS transporter [Elioraea rosea]|uniref:MFS transporter n=1 Tax=Elioraea rosea TaxID=2492390 RepID=UPI001186ABE5|nr:MFS transporter [Elioraea rosea]